METGLEHTADQEGLLTVGDAAFVPGEGSLTAILATGRCRFFRRVLGRCDIADIDVRAAGISEETLLVVVDRRHGP